MAEILVRADQLTKDYGPFRALDGLTLAIPGGEVFGLLGPNGSGKSTALRIVMGFLRPTRGDAWIGPHHCWRDGVRARRNVAYLPGELRLYERMTGREIIRFLARLRGDTPGAEVDRLAGRFDIDLTRPLVQLSSGMKRKVALLTVLVPRVPLVIMDEPTNALDPTMRDELLDLIREAKKRGQAVLFSSHVLSEVEEVCDRVAILRQGKLVHVQRIDELKAGRRVAVRFKQMPSDWPALDGLAAPQIHGDHVTLEHTGPLPPLLEWLGRQPVVELRLEPFGLGPIYHRFHGPAA